MRLKQCRYCGWVSVAVSLKQAQDEVDRFNTYFYSLPLEQRQEYYGNKPASIERYKQCFGCGGPHTNMTNDITSDIHGKTLQSILE